ncbi:hypothetical protein Bhz60_00010 [Stenotrophomonas phage vB_SmaS_Bhz60]
MSRRAPRSEWAANVALSAARTDQHARQQRTARNVQTLGDIVRRLPRLFVIAASVAAVIVIAVAHM